MTKTCNTCKQSKQISEFYRSVNKKDGLSTQCKKCIDVVNLARYHSKTKFDQEYKARQKERAKISHAKNIHKHRAQAKANHRREREECFEVYGKICACCGESRYEFLSIDHINGGGRQHRKTVTKTCRWLVKQGFPKGYRVLCHNCNQALGFYGLCPHGGPMIYPKIDYQAKHGELFETTTLH